MVEAGGEKPGRDSSPFLVGGTVWGEEWGSGAEPRQGSRSR